MQICFSFLNGETVFISIIVFQIFCVPILYTFPGLYKSYSGGRAVGGKCLRSPSLKPGWIKWCWLTEGNNNCLGEVVHTSLPKNLKEEGLQLRCEHPTEESDSRKRKWKDQWELTWIVLNCDSQSLTKYPSLHCREAILPLTSEITHEANWACFAKLSSVLHAWNPRGKAG